MDQAAAVRRQDVDRLLDHVLAQWRDVPSAANDIDSWDLAQRIDYVEELPLLEQGLARLERMDAGGELTAGQRGRLREVRELAKQYRPIIQRLRAK